MSKFTPGPWKIRYLTSGNLESIQGSPYEHEQYGRSVTNYGGISRPRSEEGLANARLISAAPDLYAALKAILKEHQEAHESEWGDEDEWSKSATAIYAREAIAKAEGIIK